MHIARLKGSLHSTQNLLKVKGNPLFDEGKAFRTWLAERRPDANSVIFNSQKSTKLNRATIFKLFRGIFEAAKIEDKTLWHPHVLKHSLAMRLVEQNVNAFLIRQQLGHKSFQSTLQYVAASDKQASEAAAKRSQRFLIKRERSPCRHFGEIEGRLYQYSDDWISRKGFTPPAEVKGQAFCARLSSEKLTWPVLFQWRYPA